jgi:hypothetical protein
LFRVPYFRSSIYPSGSRQWREFPPRQVSGTVIAI